MEEYNILTQKLLAEGYTAENYPDYVRLPGSSWGSNPLQNLHGGFEYTRQYLNQMVFRTGCGLLLKGSRLGFGSMYYMGILWIPENNNPVVTCPYRKDSCDLRNPVLGGARGGGLCKILHCDCHQTRESYDYEKSYEKALDDERQEIQRRYEEFVKRKKGHVCRKHSYYDYWAKKWSLKYDPIKCVDCPNITGVCDLTNQPISKKKGNVFYDVKISYIRNDGTLFDGEKVVKIKKGVRLFETRKSITICESAAKRCQKYILDRERGKIHREILCYGWEVEILNIRAEQREGRDLMQDLQDIQAGIEIVHASDLDRKKKEEKKKRRMQAMKKKIERLEKKLLDIGYYNLEEYSLDKIHADKWLGEDRIMELESLRNQKQREKKEEPIQINLFDLI